MKQIKIIYLLFLCLLIVACQKDKIEDEIIVVPPDTEESTTKLTIFVADLLGDALSNVTVTFGDMSGETDEKGFLLIDNVTSFKNGDVLHLSKPDYIDNIKRIIPSKEATHVYVRMIPKTTPAGTFNSSESAHISLPNGSGVSFTANTIVRDGTDNLYSGNVNVFLHHFDPDDPSLLPSMPGNLEGVDRNSSRVQLATYGMLMVNLVGSNGEKLNIKNGSTASITLPISASQADHAPSDIPLWFLDEETGLWLEDGFATKENGFYVGEVNHFSFWNCDAPFRLINLAGTLVNENNIPLSNATIEIEMVNTGMTAYGSSNDNGYFSGKVPQNADLILRVVSTCNEEIASIEIGPFNVDTDLEEILVTSNQLVTITGMVINCESEPLTDGYVLLSSESGASSLFNVANGAFTGIFYPCQGENYNLIVIDPINGFQSDDINVDISSGNPIDQGTIFVCDELEDYILFTSEGSTTLIKGIKVEILGQQLQVLAGHAEGAINLLINGISPGNYSVAQATVINNATVIGCTNTGAFSLPECGSMLTANIENLTIVDEDVNGELEGQIYVDGTWVNAKFEFHSKLRDIKEMVSGKIWHDINEDGIRNGSEKGIEDFKMKVKANGVETTFRTKDEGNYSRWVSTLTTFDIWMVDNDMYSPSNQGGDEMIDSDFNENTGRLDDQTLIHGSPIEYLDGGVVIPFDLICDIKIVTAGCTGNNAVLSLGLLDLPAGEKFSVVVDASPPVFPTSASSTLNPINVGGLPNDEPITVTISYAGTEICQEMITIPSGEPFDVDLEAKTTSCNPPMGDLFCIVDESGFGSFEYLWEDGSTNKSLTGIAPGNYFVTVSKLGCDVVESITVDFETTTISGKAFLDANGDDIYNGNDTPMDVEVTISLFTNSGTLINDATTGVDGKYSFTAIDDGQYYLESSNVVDLTIVNKDVGSNDDIDSDFDPNTMQTDVFSVIDGCLVMDNVDVGFKFQ